jgi:hypothetical protein
MTNVLLQRVTCYSAAQFAKAKTEAMSISAIFHAVAVVSDVHYPANLAAGNMYEISEQAVVCAWSFVNLLTKQRIYFENESCVSKLAGPILGWSVPGVSEEDDPEKEEEERDPLVSCQVQRGVREVLFSMEIDIVLDESRLQAGVLLKALLRF